MEWQNGKYIEIYMYMSEYRNSSALPSVGELQTEKVGVVTKETRKNSVMLPNGNTIIESGKSGGSSLAVGGSTIVGGIDNYKRY